MGNVRRLFNPKETHEYTILTRMIFGNSFYYFSGLVIRSIILFYTSVRLAKYLGVDDFGIFSYIFTFVYFFEVIPKLGMDAILVREISHNRSQAKELLGNALFARLILSLLTMFLVCGAITILKGFTKVTYLTYLCSLGLIFTFQPLYEAMFKIDLKMLCPTLVNVIKAVFYLIFVLLLIHFKCDLYGFVAASVISAFISLLLMIWSSKRYFEIEFIVNLEKSKWLLRESYPILLSGIFTFLYARSDIIILEQYKGYAAVGFYSAARKFLDTTLIIPSCICLSLFPLMAKYYKGDKHRFGKIYAFGFKYMLMIALPIVIFTLFFSEKIISIFGNSFLPSALSLRILMSSVIFSFLNVLLVNALISVGRQKVDMVVSGVLIFLNVGLNLLLIPRLSFNGASIALLLTEIATLCGYLFYFSKVTSLKISDVQIPILIAVNFVFFLILNFLKLLPLVYGVIVSLFIYSILIIASSFLKKDVAYFLGIAREKGSGND